MKRRFFLLLLALTLALSVLPAHAAQEPDSAAAEIASALENGIIPDCLIGQDLTRGLTHAELCALSVSLFEAFWQTQEIPEKTPYALVEGHPLQAEIEKAYGLGLLTDMNGDYYPDYLVTRQRAAQILCRTLKAWLYEDWTLATDDRYFLSYQMNARFQDDRDIDSAMVDSVYFLASDGLMPGMNKELFCPADVISRAAAILAANRIYLRYREAPLPDDPNVGQTAVPESILAPTAQKLSIGWERFAMIRADGSLWTWGEDYLGNGVKAGGSSPVRIMENVSSVSMSDHAGLAIQTDGSLWTWGSNNYLTVGIQDVEALTPVKIMDHVVSASMGARHAAAVTADGGLYLWGRNEDGNFSVDMTVSGIKDYPSPMRVMEDVADVRCNIYSYGAYTMALKRDGTLWTFGANSYGQLGDGQTDLGQQRYTKNSIRPRYDFAPRQILDNVTAIASGYDYAAAIRADGTLWIWGSNEKDKQGNGGLVNAKTNRSFSANTVPTQIMDSVAAVSLGITHAVALKTDGTVWAWGQGYGDTPVQVDISGVTAVCAGHLTTLAVKADGTVWQWGLGGTAKQVAGITD